MVSENEALQIATRIHQALTAPIQVENVEIVITASIGIAISDHGTDDAESFLRDADLAVYQAKDLGRGRVEICDVELKATLVERATLEQAISVALAEDEFVLHYQAIVAPQTEQVVGYEALIRWNRPGHGLLAPDDFIPFAERTGLITKIDRWVVGKVASDIASWRSSGPLSAVPISINISGRSLATTDFVANVVGPLDAHGINPDRIIIEVTESSVLNDLTSAAVKLQQLRKRGIRIAIDDFGTGYTSLAHLKSLPVDILKIDRSFTSDESAASLVKLIIDTGHLLGASVTAEGIETREQAAQLEAMGSDDLQGYLYGRPRPAEDIWSEISQAAVNSAD